MVVRSTSQKASRGYGEGFNLMGKKLTFHCAPWGLMPVDDEGHAYVTKHIAQLVQGEYKQPRSLDQNALLWAVAGEVFANLPERFQRWPSYYHMVKGLQVRLGLIDEIATWDDDGWKITGQASSIAEMNKDEATKAVDLLLDAMARLIGVDVEELKRNAALLIGSGRNAA